MVVCPAVLLYVGCAFSVDHIYESQCASIFGAHTFFLFNFRPSGFFAGRGATDKGFVAFVILVVMTGIDF